MTRNFKEDEYVIPMSGNEFRESGALWFVNNILHLFGMALTWDPKTGEIKPAYVRFRGFSLEINDMGYKKLTTYLKENIDELEKECD